MEGEGGVEDTGVVRRLTEGTRRTVGDREEGKRGLRAFPPPPNLLAALKLTESHFACLALAGVVVATGEDTKAKAQGSSVWEEMREPRARMLRDCIHKTVRHGYIDP